MKLDSGKETYARWQNTRNSQLGLCISLFLAFAVATLGFSISLLVQHSADFPGCSSKVSFLASLLFGLLSTLTGGAACMTRLEDFRKTAYVVRHRANLKMSQEVELARKSSKRFGCWTWGLFRAETILLFLQISCVTCSLVTMYWHRLMG